MISDGAEVFTLGDLTLDLARGRLLSAKGDVVLRPKAFSLLTILARRCGNVVSKDDLMREVWPDVIVTEDSLTQCVHDIRQALGPSGASLLQTVPRRGYMLSGLGVVAAMRPDTETQVDPGTIAVMPFVIHDGVDLRSRILFDGLAHDIISHLARLRAFRVTGRGSVFALRPFSEDALRLRQLLRVDRVVSGRTLPSGRGDGASVRLLIDVVRTEDGSIEWTDEVLVSPDELHRSSSRIADRLVSAISQAVTEGEVRRALAGRRGGQDAWEEFHLGLNAAFAFTEEGMRAALGHLQQAVDLDSGFARAHAYVSFCQYHLAFTNRLGNRKAGAAVALASAARALEADAVSPVAHWAYGRALWLGGDPEGGMRHVSQAISLCPSFPNAHYMLGFLECHAGDAARALVCLDESESLSPFDPFLPSIQITRAISHMRLGEMDEAAVWASRATTHPSAYGHMLANAALVLEAAGRRAEARQTLDHLLALEPKYDPENLFETFYTLPTDIAQSFRGGFRRLQG